MKLAKNIVYAISITIILIIIFATKAQAATGTVSTDTLNLRSEASTLSSIVKLLNADDELEIISEEGNWYKVKYGDDEGYVSKDYVKVTSTDTTSTNTGNSGTIPDTTPNLGQDVNTANTTITISQDTPIKILPLINANQLGSIKNGEKAKAITKTNNWTFIETDTISGWIVSTAISGYQATNPTPTETVQEPETTGNGEQTPTTEEPVTKESTTETPSTGTNYETNVTKYINVSSAYIRSEASTSSRAVTSLIRNTDVIVTGEDGDWYKVKYGDYTGYIYKELLSDTKAEETNRSNSSITTTSNVTKNTSNTTENSSKGAEIVEYAKQYLGCPYVYGAAGSSSFDCSGFTMYVFKHFGYSLSHSATAQSKNGTYVAKEDLQLGDLVFFLDYETMEGIGHCGIYIGDGNFIHASSGTGYCVKISTLLSGSYYNRYSTARRLI